MSDTGPAAPDSEHLAHRPERLPSGAIVCPGCSLRVERPPGMPDYSRATMRDW